MNERTLTISTGANRRDIHWRQQALTVSDLYRRLSAPTLTLETFQAFTNLPKAERDNVKDVGGFVGGQLSGGRRKANAVLGRDIVTLDLDNIKPYETQAVLDRVQSLGCSACVYSSHSHCETKPRLRVIVPLDRTISVDEYEPIARKIADSVGIERCDPTTFEASRLMYWPSKSSDGEYVYQVFSGPIASADTWLASYALEGKRWQDVTAWPQVPGTPTLPRLAVKQGDPLTKTGLVGVFCRAYDIRAAMDAFLPGIYAPCDDDPNRFTYTGGSTTGGAVLYDDGKFLYSHHATDPCSNKLVNAFDMVRLHKYGERDDDAAEGTPVSKLPSYQAMRDLAAQDARVSSLEITERMTAAEDFAGLEAVTAEPVDAMGWTASLARDGKGVIQCTPDNVLTILEHDPNFQKADPKKPAKIALNLFSDRVEVTDTLPWDTRTERRWWTDTDNDGLYWYLEKIYMLSKRTSIDTALNLYAKNHAFNDVREYLCGLVWDGTPRLDTLFIDYLGAEDDAYTRAVTRKAFTAAVARVMRPGCKYDNMLILCGPQGIGKSTILEKMSRGWFNDSIRTFEGKDASELLPGVWLVEIAELDAFRRTDVSRIKQFLSLDTDRYREAYGRNMKEFPRRCVFFGTCNQTDFLQDTTGNRRFWPVDVGGTRSKSVWTDLPEAVIDQLWAEAKYRWQNGEELFLKGDLEEMAKERQEYHREASPQEGWVREFSLRKVPEDWIKWDLQQRQDFWAGSIADLGDYKLVERDRICPVEVWCELFNGIPANANRCKYDIQNIKAVLQSMPEWSGAAKPMYFGKQYGTQRGFWRVYTGAPDFLSSTGK